MEPFRQFSSENGFHQIIHGEGISASLAIRYLLSIVFFVLALLYRLYFYHGGTAAALFMFYSAVATSSLLCGFRPALLTFGLSVSAACTFYFLPNILPEPSNMATPPLLSFVLSGFIICVLAGGMQYNFSQLQARQLRLMNLYDNSPCGYHSLDKNGYFLEVNATEASWIGYTKEELIGKRRLVDFFSPASQKKFWEVFAKFPKDGNSNRGEYELVGRNGSIRNIVVTSSALTDESGNLLASRTVLHDITERKRADEIRQSSERAMCEAQRLAHIGSWKWEQSTCHTIWSEQLYEIFGCDAASPPLKFSELRTFFDSRDWHNFSDCLRRCNRLGETFSCELTLNRPDGVQRFVTICGSAKLALDGRVEMTMGTVQDFTERHIFEQKLKRSRAQLKTFIEQAPTSFAMLDRDMRYLAYSSRWLKDYCGNYSSPIGLSHYDVVPDVSEEWKAVHSRALAGESIKNDQECWYRADGSERWVRWAVFPWVDETDHIGGIIISSEDISNLKRAESDLRTVLEESGDAIWITDRNGQFVYVNPAGRALTGHSAQEICSLSIPDLVADHQLPELTPHLDALREQRMLRGEWHLKCKNGGVVCTELTTGSLSDGRMMAFGRDLTEKKHSESERSKLFRAVEQSPDGIVITDTAGVVEYVNLAFIKKTGYNSEEIVGKNPRILQSGRTPVAIYVDMWNTLKSGGVWQGEVVNCTKSGEEFTVLSTMSPIAQPDGRITNYVAIQEDITERKRGEQKIHELAFYDQLTGLPNRTLLLDRLQQVLAVSERCDSCGALLFIDLDHFKSINDTAGHNIGDLLLKRIAQILTECMRKEDTIVRFGGDEFVVLLPDLGNNISIAATAAETASNKILAEIDHTFLLGEFSHHCTASIGVTIFNGKHATADELLKQADMSMYEAKKAGRNTMCFFDPQLEAEVRQRAELESEMRRALELHQFQVYYQAQFDDDRGLTGAEVLVRWLHPQRGMISPALFIPHAEATGLILPLGTWVLETACRQLAIWRSDPTLGKLTLAVNVSAHQFHQEDFVDHVKSVLARTGANPLRLKLELTESMLIDRIDDVILKMSLLKKIGVAFSLDDFGTGYSSLSYLKRLPLDQLKIDQSFVRDVLTDSNDATIAKTITTLAQSLGLQVIAEGVETQEQRTFLATVGCHAYQGYLFSKPVALASFEALVHHESFQIEAEAAS